MTKKILFVSHGASLTGAPLVLMNFLKWISANNLSWECDVLFLRGGELLEEFRPLCKNIYVLSDANSVQRWYKRYPAMLFNKLGYPGANEKLYRLLAGNKYDIVYCNSVASLTAGLEVKRRSSPRLILHLHELQIVIKMFCPDFQTLSKEVDHFVAVADALKKMLINTFGVGTDKISNIPEFINPVNTSEIVKKTDKDTFVIGASGEVHWRKGPVFFLLVAKRVAEIMPQLKAEFVWVGSFGGDDKTILEADMEKLGISNVTFTGKTKSPFSYFKDFDLFLMTSVEDPFPLVCIEVAAMGIPIISFQDAGGTAEWIPDTAVVPYLSIEAMAEAVIKRLTDRSLYENESAEVRATSSQFTTSVQAPKLASIINRL